MFMTSPKSSGSTGEVALKIYGERNTGTNYLTLLAERNLCARILPGRVVDSDLRTVLTRRLRRLVPGFAHQMHETARDRYFEATFSDNLGWKHMNPSVERIGAEALSAVRFMMIIKNPYAWLLSLYQRPYHVGGSGDSFEAFLDQPLPVMEQRENIGPDPLRPVEVWNRKMQGYETLRRAARHAVIVRYEDFLIDETAALELAAARLGIPVRDRHEPVEDGVKQSDQNVTHEDYVRYYLEERWRHKLSAAALEKINATLDAEFVKRLGYDLLRVDDGRPQGAAEPGLR